VSAADAPDLAGFRDAQERKRLALGEDVIFRWPAQRVYAAGVSLNAEGEPLDPTVRRSRRSCRPSPSTPAWRRASGRCSASAARASRARPGASSAARSWSSATSPTPRSSTARRVRARRDGETFQIIADREDGVSIPDRYLVYGREET
jgi:hypothetical protein